MEHTQSMIKDTEKPGNRKKRTIPFILMLVINCFSTKKKKNVGYQFS